MKTTIQELPMESDKKTVIYFIRHAEPDFSVRDNYVRDLTEAGHKGARELVTKFKDISISHVYSSPYKRTVSTVIPLAQSKNLSVETLSNLKERKSADYQVPSELFQGYGKRQWKDFNFRFRGGESLNDVKNRYNKAIEYILRDSLQHGFKDVIVCCHIAGLMSYLSQFDTIKSYEEYKHFSKIMPLIVKCTYFENELISCELPWSEQT